MRGVVDFADELERQGKSPATVWAYTRDLEHAGGWLRAASADDPVTVTTAQLVAYRDSLLQGGAAPSTVNRRLSALRAFFRWAHATGRAPSNPAALVIDVPRPRPPPRRLGERERAALVRAVQASGNARDLAIVLLLERAGLGVGDVARLRLDDVALTERSGSVLDRPLDAETRRAIDAYLAVRPASTQRALFLSQLDRGLTANGIHGLVVAHGRRAGHARATPRMLRPEA